MKLHILFSRNKKIGSKAISWASSYEKLKNVKEIPSHVAVLLDNGIVVESVLNSGVRMAPYTKWKEINEELYKIPHDCPKRDMKSALDIVWGKKYDFMGILFFVWRFLSLIMFNKPMPKTNRWERHSKLFCTEYAGLILNKNLSMKTPAKLCDELLEK